MRVRMAATVSESVLYRLLSDFPRFFVCILALISSDDPPSGHVDQSRTSKPLGSAVSEKAPEYTPRGMWADVAGGSERPIARKTDP